MAKIGLKYPVYAQLTETGNTLTYSAGAVLAKAISANVSITTSDVKLYADDAVAESDRSFTSGTLSFGIDELSDKAKVDLLGYIEGATADATTGSKELTAGTNTPAYVGFGFYGAQIKNKAKYYRAIWLKKVQFAEPSDEMATKGESVAFGTPTLEGVVMLGADGKWKEEATFATEAGAKTWLENKAGIGSGTSAGLTALEVFGGNLAPTFETGQLAYVVNDISIALPRGVVATGTGTIKLYIDGVYRETLTSGVESTWKTIGPWTGGLVEITVEESGKKAVKYTIISAD